MLLSKDQEFKFHSLVAGQDYPRTYREFVEMFPDEDTCLRYIEGLRWPDGFICPACGNTNESWRASRGRLVCSACHKHVRIGAGTLLIKRAPHLQHGLRLHGMLPLQKMVCPQRLLNALSELVTE